MIVDLTRLAAALPGYELGGQLGQGAFGTVLAARHRALGLPVAIKIVVVGDGATPDGAGEAWLLARLHHPHIVRLYDYVEADDLHLIVMEFLAGGTLAARQREGLSPEAACAVGVAVAAALFYLHGQRVLHRNVKPGNVLFDTAGLPKIAGFGLAKIMEESADTSEVVGTPLYMAPEQILGGRLGPGTDIYALGVVLYQLLAGTPPFGPAMRVLEHHLYTAPTPPAGVPAPVAEVVLRALAKDPAERHPSAYAFALDLAEAATRAYGLGWASRSGIVLHLDDEVREAIDHPLTPTRQVPVSPRSAPPVAPTPRSRLRAWLSTRRHLTRPGAVLEALDLTLPRAADTETAALAIDDSWSSLERDLDALLLRIGPPSPKGTARISKPRGGRG